MNQSLTTTCKRALGEGPGRQHRKARRDWGGRGANGLGGNFRSKFPPPRLQLSPQAPETSQGSQLYTENYSTQKWLCREGAQGPWAWERTLSLPSQSPKEVPMSYGLGDQATCLCQGYDPGLRSLQLCKGWETASLSLRLGSLTPDPPDPRPT